MSCIEDNANTVERRMIENVSNIFFMKIIINGYLKNLKNNETIIEMTIQVTIGK